MDLRLHFLSEEWKYRYNRISRCAIVLLVDSAISKTNERYCTLSYISGQYEDVKFNVVPARRRSTSPTMGVL